MTILPTNNRKEETIIRRLRLGHIRITHEFLLKNERNRPKCEVCDTFLSINHILYHYQRRALLAFLNQAPSEKDENNNESRLLQIGLFRTRGDRTSEWRRRVLFFFSRKGVSADRGHI